jgi:hypothetical protein
VRAYGPQEKEGSEGVPRAPCKGLCPLHSHLCVDVSFAIVEWISLMLGVWVVYFTLAPRSILFPRSQISVIFAIQWPLEL